MVWSMNCESCDAAEELLDGRDHGLGVDQVVRHRRVDVLVDGHLLLDGPLHPHQADAELVLQQLAHARTRRLPRLSMSSTPPDVLRAGGRRYSMTPEEVVRRQRLLVDRHLGVAA